jgi:hypothetical protein
MERVSDEQSCHAACKCGRLSSTDERACAAESSALSNVWVISKAVTRRAVAAAVAHVDKRAALPEAARCRSLEWRAKLSRGALLPPPLHTLTSVPALPRSSALSNDWVVSKAVTRRAVAAAVEHVDKRACAAQSSALSIAWVTSKAVTRRAVAAAVAHVDKRACAAQSSALSNDWVMSKAVTRHVVAAAIARIGERARSVKAASHRIIWWRAKLSRSALCRRHPHIDERACAAQSNVHW